MVVLLTRRASPQCRARRCGSVLLAAAAALGLLAGARPVNAESRKRPQELASLDYSRVALARSLSGAVATFDRDAGRLDLWGARGRHEATCTLDPTMGVLTGGILGLSGNRVIFASPAGEKSTFVLMAVPGCRLSERREIPDVGVLNVFPAKDGWLLQVLDLKSRTHRVLFLDESARVSDSFVLESQDVRCSVDADDPRGQATVPLYVDGEVWLLPQSSYTFVRPRQKGKEPHCFVPPGCMMTGSRQLSDAERREVIQRAALSAPQTARYWEHVAKQDGKSVFGAVVGVSSYRAFAGLVVREKGSSTCRLDIWDMATERLVLTKRLGSACPSTIWMSDTDLVYVGGGAPFTTLDVSEALSSVVDDPCQKLSEAALPLAGGDRGSDGAIPAAAAPEDAAPATSSSPGTRDGAEPPLDATRPETESDER